LLAAGDAIYVERGRLRHLLLRCPCGCDEIFPINLDARAGPAWRLRHNSDESISIFPSVWRESGCHSHFVIWRDRILLFGTRDSLLSTSTEAREQRALKREIMRRVSHNTFTGAEQIADSMGADPWDVLASCQLLESEGELIEGEGANKGLFRRESER